MLIENGKVFTGDRFETGIDIRVVNGIVSEVGEKTGADNGENRIDLEGDYLLPGFVDVHIHAYRGSDTMRGEADVRRMSRELAKAGTGAFCPTTMSASVQDTAGVLSDIRKVIERPEGKGARVLGAHMEAPFLSPKYKGAQRAECLRLPSMEAYREITGDLSCVRMMTIAPELPGAIPLIRALHERGVILCAAHSAATAEQVHQAADAGLTQITHLFNAQTPLHHRDPGVPGAGLADDRLAVQVIADGIHLHPDVLRIAALCKGSRGMILISDSMEAAGLPEGTYELGGQKVLVSGGAARLENGVLAGSTLLLHQAVKNMICLAGIAPECVIPMATSTPADSIGASEFGRISVGACGVLAEMNPEWEFVTTVCERESL